MPQNLRFPVPARLRRLAAPALVLAAAGAAACAEVGTDPSAPFSVEFTGLPSPAILVADTLRDLQGNPVDLRTAVRVFNADNEPLTGYPVTFLAINDSARIAWDSTTGFLVSYDTTSRTTVGIQATAGRLVPAPVTLNIVRSEPRTLTEPADTAPARLIYTLRSVENSTRALQATVNADTGTVSNWPVQFRIVTLPASLDSVRFIASATDTLRSSPFDTTSSGVAARFVRGWAKPSVTTASDTLVVEALLRVRREAIDTLRYRVPVIIQRTGASP